MKKLLFSFGLVVALGLVACSNSSNDRKDYESKGELVQTSLRFDWITNMSFCGDVYGAKEAAQNNGISLKLEQAGEGIDPIKMVLSGRNDFGVVSFEKLLMANEKGANLVAIGFANYISPVVFLTKKDHKLSTPRDFEGKTVGVTPGGATEYVYRTFVAKEGLNSKKIKETPADFDLRGFLANKYDIRLAFNYVEPVDLEKQGIPYTVMEPKNFGFLFPGRVYFTTKEFLINNPSTVQKFINTVAQGWLKTFTDSTKAISLLKEYDNSINVEREKESVKKGLSYYRGYKNKVLTTDTESLKEMIKLLQKIRILKEVDLQQSLDTSFVANFHKKHTPLAQ